MGAPPLMPGDISMTAPPSETWRPRSKCPANFCAAFKARIGICPGKPSLPPLAVYLPTPPSKAPSWARLLTTPDTGRAVRLLPWDLVRTRVRGANACGVKVTSPAASVPVTGAWPALLAVSAGAPCWEEV